MPLTQITIELTGVGGVPPYIFSVGLPGTFQGAFGVVTQPAPNRFTLDATSVSPGLYTANFVVVDANSIAKTVTINVRAVDNSIFTILTEPVNYATPFVASASVWSNAVGYLVNDVVSRLGNLYVCVVAHTGHQPPNTNFWALYSHQTVVPLVASGAVGSVVWTIIPSATTLPGVTQQSIDAFDNLVFTLPGFGSWTVGVQAKDSLGNVASRVLLFTVPSTRAFQLVDGQIEIMVDVPPLKQNQTHSFTLVATDSASGTIAKQFSYFTDFLISDIRLQQAYFDHYWDANDTTTIVFPVLGDFQGLSLAQPSGPLFASNGLTVTVDAVNGIVKVEGPPGPTFRNSEIRIPLVTQQGSSQVGIISREYTLLAHDSGGVTGDIGAVDVFTRPYIVGDFVGLNALKPLFNSPNIFKDSSWTVRVQTGSALPLGLSLDANTGLIYGTIVGTFSAFSVLEYFDVSGVVHGTATIHWDTQKNDFLLIDGLVDGQIQTTYSALLTSTSQVPLTSMGVYRGQMPAGITMGTVGTQVSFGGVPTEAGYFDVWFQVFNANRQASYLYHRFVVDYINPLTIVTTSLPTVTTNIPYSFLLQGSGGVPPYTWTLDGVSPALPTSITLGPLGSISGVTADSAYDQNIIVDLSDFRGASVSAQLNLKIDNTLRITTIVLPSIVPGQSYSFQMQAAGGTPPYTWDIGSSPTLPSGINFASVAPTFGSGAFSGVTSSPYSQIVNITLKDSTAAISPDSPKPFALKTGIASGMLIDTSGIGPIDRGGPYLGTLRATGSFTTPVEWQVAPDSPNPLPTGLFLQANAINNGSTASVTGVTTVKILSSNPTAVKVIAVDANGNSAQAIMLLFTFSSLAVATTTLPPAIVNAAYSFQLLASGPTAGAPYAAPTWSLLSVSPALPVGDPYIVTSSGLLQGTGNTVYTGQVTVAVQDSLSPADTAQATLNFQVQNSTLTITTTSLPSATSGRSYSTTLAAVGGATPYTWSIDPSSAAQLPSGLQLDAATGTISGTTSLTGFSGLITFRVTDSIGAFVSKALLLQVIAGLTLQTGIDYIDGTSTGIIGYIAHGQPDSLTRPNLSFFIIASGVISTSLSQLSISLGSGDFQATPNALDTTAGVASFRLSGSGFAAASVGSHVLPVSVTDNGVNVTASFTWVVYDDGVMRIAPSSDSLPTQLTQ